MLKKLLLAYAAFFLLLFGISDAQSSFPSQGLHINTPDLHYFSHCNIVRSPGDVILDGAMLIRNGIVENIGKEITAPAGAVKHDLHGFWIFPGFITPWSSIGLEKPKKPGAGDPGWNNGGPRYKRVKKGPYGWNDAVKPEQVAAEMLQQNAKVAKDLRSAGFTTANIVPNDGLIRGLSALLNLGEENIQTELLATELASVFSLKKGKSTQSYPSSQMGNIALIRQTLLDAKWYASLLEQRASRPGMPQFETNLSLAALSKQLASAQPLLFECSNWQEVLRADKIAKEFGLKFTYKMEGDAYQRLEALKATGSGLIVSLDFPQTLEVTDPADAREVPLRTMWHWEAAPLNPGALEKAGIPFAFHLSPKMKPGTFWANIKKAIHSGLSEEGALAALTTTPAKMLGMESRIGKLEPGKIANFFISEKNVFGPFRPLIFENWTAGKRHILKNYPLWDARGEYQISAAGKTMPLLIEGTVLRPKATVVQGKDTLDAILKMKGMAVELGLPLKKGATQPSYRLFGVQQPNGDLVGDGNGPEGNQIEWSASLIKGPIEKKDTTKAKKELPVSEIPKPRFPFSPYGNVELPQEGIFLIKNATVWTNTSEGVLENAEVLIAKGKIQGVGKGLLVPPNAEVIDGKGMHVTPGIIDEHSHIAISKGVNEGSHAISAEVSIGDVVRADDINIYRQLSGGVTTSQLLHGSANPIGGQSAIIKLRWGALPEDMKFAEAPGFIKFALGENVKQSNWGEKFNKRYPQTRMGVEQFVTDQFQSALEYRKAWEEFDQGVGAGIPPRRDLQMETVLEILDSKRFITCHSYVQSEIVMLMRLAESFGFRINTFTHILEGYKVAPKLKAHGVSASTFSDWWAYKYEVIDAIPYNASLLNKAKINVCINSDDAEMGRRLNQEAAKAVKYGGTSEEEALKMVTLNPAKALRVDNYVGSIEKGKHADLVLWSDHPLSVYALAQKTFIDGRLYFDREADAKAQEFVGKERQRLIQKMVASPEPNKKKFEGENSPQLYHCDTMEYDETE
mgnify:CR=1 FL=1